MGSTTVIIKPFEDIRFKVTSFENTIVKVTPFQDFRIVLPGSGEDDQDEGFITEDGSETFISEDGEIFVPE